MVMVAEKGKRPALKAALKQEANPAQCLVVVNPAQAAFVPDANMQKPSSKGRYTITLRALRFVSSDS